MNKRFVSTTVMLIICVSCLLSACSHNKKQLYDYYSEKENYITVTGTVTHISYNEDRTALYIGFDETSPALDDTAFKIVADNLQIAQDNGIGEKLTVGDQIEFITAPRYFGDGYVMPIVALSINGETLLTFEAGYPNLLNYLQTE